MKLSFKRYFSDYGPNILATCGYRPFRSPYNPQDVSYVRPLTHGEWYPRFHIYITTDTEEEFAFTVHLDQKATSHEGVSSHSGEYDPEKSAPLKAEIERLEREINALP